MRGNDGTTERHDGTTDAIHQRVTTQGKPKSELNTQTLNANFQRHNTETFIKFNAFHWVWNDDTTQTPRRRERRREHKPKKSYSQKVRKHNNKEKKTQWKKTHITNTR